jgi:hypothetical protein
MKIQRLHYTIFLKAVAALPRDKILAHKAQNLGNDKTKRFVWDLFWEVRATMPLAISDRLYDYLDDTHIETAMRKIAKKLNYID